LRGWWVKIVDKVWWYRFLGGGFICLYFIYKGCSWLIEKVENVIYYYWCNLAEYYWSLGILICIGGVLLIKFIFYFFWGGKLIVGWVYLFTKFKFLGGRGWGTKAAIYFIYVFLYYSIYGCIYILYLAINKLLYRILGKLCRYYRLDVLRVVLIVKVLFWKFRKWRILKIFLNWRFFMFIFKRKYINELSFAIVWTVGMMNLDLRWGGRWKFLWQNIKRRLAISIFYYWIFMMTSMELYYWHLWGRQGRFWKRGELKLWGIGNFFKKMYLRYNLIIKIIHSLAKKDYRVSRYSYFTWQGIYQK